MTANRSGDYVPPCGAVCRFPGCEGPAPLLQDEDTALYADHERLRFYAPAEFARAWEQLTPER